MTWIVSVLLIGLIGLSAIGRAQRTGEWRWSRFALALGFAVFEGLLVAAPPLLMNMNAPYFLWVWGATWVIAIVLMIWFALWARRWKTPQAGRD
jgi:hypothetical protein